MKNWWYYYKWYVLCGSVLFCIAARLIGNALGWFSKTPDIQIAYIGETRLPDDTVSALENAFARLAGDYNHDGETLVQINQFIDKKPDNGDADMFSYRQACITALMGDITDCESYFFLMEKPKEVQKEFQVLAMPDGSCPDDTDFSTEGKVFQWKSCSLLSGQELGSYAAVVLGETESGNNQELLSDLYLGRRCFYNKKQTKYADKCSQLWDILQGGLG